MMDRSAKRLYRQRGSHLRRTVDLDNVVVIKTPLRTTSNNNNNNNNSNVGNFDLSTPSKLQNDENNALFDLDHTFHHDDDGFNRGVPIDNTTVDPNYNQIHSYDNSKFKWKHIPVSKISLISINVLQSIFNHIFKNILILKANNDLKKLHNSNNNNNNIQSLMYSIDLKIFNNLLNSINKDFNDVKDINIANNELYFQLQRLKRIKRKLTTKLINIKQECNIIKQTTYHYHKQNNNNNNNNNKQSKLNNKLLLNQNLNRLTRILSKKELPSDLLMISTEDTRNQNILLSLQINDNNLLKINKLCQLLDPYNGTLSKIKNINRKLSKLSKKNSKKSKLSSKV